MNAELLNHSFHHTSSMSISTASFVFLDCVPNFSATCPVPSRNIMPPPPSLHHSPSSALWPRSSMTVEVSNVGVWDASEYAMADNTEGEDGKTAWRQWRDGSPQQSSWTSAQWDQWSCARQSHPREEHVPAITWPRRLNTKGAGEEPTPPQRGRGSNPLRRPPLAIAALPVNN